MKPKLPFSQILLGLGVLALLALAAPRTASAEMSTAVFYDALDPYGDWIKTDEYGYAFHPRDVDENWRPYTDGNWAYTDAGWTFVSEEPYAWATYHYGRWADLESTGWVWVPDTEWAPAWVSWRRSDKYIGWSPLPPEARFTRETGFHAWVDSNYDIGPAHYNFVQVRDLGAPRLRTVLVQPRENITIIRETRNITNVTYVNNVVMNNGPEYDVVTRQSSQPIRRLRLDRSEQFNDAADFRDRNRTRNTVSGDSLRIVAPMFTAVERSVAPKKVARTVTNVQVNRGWKNAGTPEQVQQVRATIAAEPKAPASVVAATKMRGANRAAAPAADASADPAVAPPTTAARPAAPAAEMPPATPAAKKGKNARTATTGPAAAPAPAADAPATPSPKGPATARQIGRPGKPGAAANDNAPTASTTAPAERPAFPDAKHNMPPGESIPPGQPAGPAPRVKRGPAAGESANVPPGAERRMSNGAPKQDPAPGSAEDARPGAKMKGPKGAHPEGAPDRSPSEARPESKSPESAPRERPPGRGPAAERPTPAGDRPAPPSANRPPENRPPGAAAKPPGKSGKPAAAEDDDKKKKGEAPQ